MKTLILFRHGKSDWDTDTGEDHERRVGDRGRKAARTMGKFLSLTGQAPDAAVTSSAVRARTTLDLAREAGKWACPVRVTRALYEATPFIVLEEIRAEPDTTTTLLLAGHEPTWSELSSLLIGGGIIEFPTAAMIRIDLEIAAWKEAGQGKGVLVWHVPPKLFTKGEFDFVE